MTIQFSSIHLLSTLLLFLLFLLLMFFKSSKTKSPISKSPPQPWKLPVIGNLHQLAGPLPHYALRNLAKKYGPIMKLELGEVLAIVISSPEAAREVLHTNELVFAQRPSTVIVKMISHDHLGVVFSPYGEYWRQMRKVCASELLNAKRVQSFRSIREEEAWNLVESIYSSNGVPINLREMFVSFTNVVISRAAFGNNCRAQEEFASLVKELLALGSGFHVADLFPSVEFLSFITGMRLKVKRAHQKLAKILDEIISDHDYKIKPTESKDDQSFRERDLVDVLLKLRESNELKFGLTTDHVRFVISDMFAAGSETAAITLEWAMAELLRNQRVMNKAQAEVRQVFGGKQRVEETGIHKLDYLKLIVKETLRLHPPGPLVPRESRERCEIFGYKVPEKAKVIVNVWALGRDPEIWSNPDCFHPERFIGSSIDFKGTNFEFLPFGAGRRMCPGISFASANIELALAHMLHHFCWKLPNGAKPEELDMTESFGATSRMKNDLYAIATPFDPCI